MNIGFYIPDTTIGELLGSPLLPVTVTVLALFIACVVKRDHWLLNKNSAIVVAVSYIAFVVGGLVLPSSWLLLTILSLVAVYIVVMYRKTHSGSLSKV